MDSAGTIGAQPQAGDAWHCHLPEDSGGVSFFVAECIDAEKRFIDFVAIESGISQKCYRIEQGRITKDVY